MAFDSPLPGRRVRPSGLVAAGLSALLLAGLSTGARAQSAECTAIGEVLKRQGELSQTAQGYSKKKMTPALIASACATFGKLSANTSEAIAKLEKDGDWCHAPANIVEALKASQPNIAKAQKNACTAAANVKKMEQQARQQQEQQKKQQLQGAGPIGGGGDVLGGHIKVPQGAL
jgi:hypothetical protein